MSVHTLTHAYKKQKLGDTRVEFDHNAGIVTMDGEELPAASIEYLILFGAKQSIANSYAVTAEEAAKMTHDDFVESWKAQKAKIIAGTMGIRTGGGVDDVTVRARELADKWAKMKYGAEYAAKFVKKPDGERYTAAERYAKFDAIIAQTDLMDQARDAIEREREELAQLADMPDIELPE